jgi:hypothetical protein
MGAKRSEVLWSHHQSAACGQDDSLTGFEFLDQPGLQSPEMTFAFLCEDVRDPTPLTCFDDSVGVDEFKAQHLRQNLADGRFPNAHETNESDVVILALRLHGVE